MFINGLEKLYKIKIFLAIYIIFIASWISIIINGLFRSAIIIEINFLIYKFIVPFSLILIIFSFFKRMKEMGWKIFLLVFALSIIPFFFLVFIPQDFILYLFEFFFYMNQLLTALFAFKFCMDTSTKVDNYLYKKNGNKITRTLEFFVFGVLDIFILWISWIYFHRLGPIGRIFAPIFPIFILVNLAMILFVFIRLLIIKRFSAYISLFFVLNFIYILYIVFSVYYNVVTSDDLGFSIISFLIDLLIFTFILGAIFDKADYFEEKLKIIKADTLALFFFLMKIFIQVPEILRLQIINEIFAAWGLIIIFIGTTIFFGIYSIFAHKAEKS